MSKPLSPPPAKRPSGPASDPLIAGAVAEVDPAQIAITRRLTPAQRFTQMLSMIEFAENVAARQLRRKHPDLDHAEALRKVRTFHVKF